MPHTPGRLVLPALALTALLTGCRPLVQPSSDPTPAPGDTGGQGSADGGSDGGGVAGDGGGQETKDGGGEDDTGTDPGDGGGAEEPEPLTGAVSVEHNPANPFSLLVHVTMDAPAQVRVAYGEGTLTRETPAQAALAGEPIQLQVLGLHAAQEVHLRVEATDGDREWHSGLLVEHTDPLPADFPTCVPRFTADPSGFDPAEVTCSHLLTPSGRSLFACYDYWGQPVYALETATNDSLLAPEPLVGGGWAATSLTASSLLFLDETGVLTASLAPSYFAADTRFEHDLIDSHDVIQLKAGPWTGALAFITITEELLGDGTLRAGNGLVVIDPDTYDVLYDYSFHGEAGDSIPMDPAMPYDRRGNGDAEGDWTHVNSVLHGLDADGRQYFLLSLKAQDWIFKLYPDSDELAWAFGFGGDFELVDDLDDPAASLLSPLDFAYHQHGMVFVDRGPLAMSGDGRLRLLLFDNGLPRHDGISYRWDMEYSRVVQFELDPDAGLADIDWSVGSSEEGAPGWFFSSACGNALITREGDRALYLDGENATRVELSYPGGDERWRMTCDTVDFCEYEVQWYPSLYELLWSH